MERAGWESGVQAEDDAPWRVRSRVREQEGRIAMKQEGAKPPRQSPSSQSEAMDTDGSPMDLYANAEVLRHHTGSPQKGTEPGSSSRRQMEPDLYVNAEALDQKAARGTHRRLHLPDSPRLKTSLLTPSDVALGVTIPAIFFLGFWLGRTRRFSN